MSLTPTCVKKFKQSMVLYSFASTVNSKTYAKALIKFVCTPALSTARSDCDPFSKEKNDSLLFPFSSHPVFCCSRPAAGSFSCRQPESHVKALSRKPRPYTYTKAILCAMCHVSDYLVKLQIKSLWMQLLFQPHYPRQSPTNF